MEARSATWRVKPSGGATIGIVTFGGDPQGLRERSE
jgi:hypothetical protein